MWDTPEQRKSWRWSAMRLMSAEDTRHFIVKNGTNLDGVAQGLKYDNNDGKRKYTYPQSCSEVRS
jgi:hypothetical protein